MEDLFIAELFARLFTYCVFRPFLWACQAVAGLLASDLSLGGRIVQILGLGCLVFGSVALAVCFVGPALEERFLAGTFVSGCVSLSLAGVIGYQLEKPTNSSS